MSKLGEDITEVLDYVPGHFQVIRHLRPKYAFCDRAFSVKHFRSTKQGHASVRGRHCRHLMRTEEADGSKSVPRAQGDYGRCELVLPSSLLGTSGATRRKAA